MVFIDDVEEPHHEVAPAETVYSYFLFVGPVESKKEGQGTTWDTLMAYVLVGLTIFMQGVLLFAIWDRVVVDDIDWRASIMNPGTEPDDGGGLGLFGVAGDGCNPGNSLCTWMNNSYTCSPPSVQLAGRWDELDLNGDGVWTLAEAEEARESLKCKYVADPIEVFHVFVRMLVKRDKLIWIHPDLRAGKEIDKAYFNYAAGDINMCGYRNTDMCANVLQRGVFDAPLEHGTAPRVGKTVASAMDYCYDLLKPGGACERLLPSTYKVWKTASVKQCGEAKFNKFEYQSPGPDGQTTSLLEVDYKKRQNYARVQTPIFKIYKSIIIGLYLSAMVLELKRIFVVANWCIKFPAASKFGKDAVLVETNNDGAQEYTIQGVTHLHRLITIVITMIRFLMLVFLVVVGLVFLNKQVSFVGLLLDGIAMLFILDISEIMYAQLLRKSVQDQTQNVKPMVFDAIGIDFLNRRPAVRQIAWLVFIVVTSAFLVKWSNDNAARPLYEALTCTCNGEGETCREASTFSFDFWKDYWLNTVPASLARIKELSKGAPEGHEVVKEAVKTSKRLLFSPNWHHHHLKHTLN